MNGWIGWMGFHSIPCSSTARPYLQVRQRVAHAHGQGERAAVGVERQEAVQLQQIALHHRNTPVAEGCSALGCWWGA